MDNVFTMECYECGAVLSEEDDLIDECPFCGDMIYGEDVLRCPTCDSLYTFGSVKTAEMTKDTITSSANVRAAER